MIRTLLLRCFSLVALAFIFLAGTAIRLHAQNILVVNDNDNILYNTDTIINDLDHSSYSGYTYWSIPDSAGAYPSGAYMSAFDLVIWYCSTDGVGLKIWDGTATDGNPELLAYAGSGKPLWIIGQDILYQKYTTGSTFTAGEFPKDVMGLTSYDVQSYADDGSTGCPEVNKIASASSLFPATLHWIFPTAWYVDGCTPDAATLSLYQMGPSTYSLNGKKCMFHNRQFGVNVMSTFFDPALIDTFPNRVTFMENSITYLLGTVGVTNNTALSLSARLYPNPATTSFTLDMYSVSTQEVSITLFNALGVHSLQQQTILTQGRNKTNIPVSNLAPGMYMVKVTGQNGQMLYTGKLNKL